MLIFVSNGVLRKAIAWWISAWESLTGNWQLVSSPLDGAGLFTSSASLTKQGTAILALLLWLEAIAYYLHPIITPRDWQP